MIANTESNQYTTIMSLQEIIDTLTTQEVKKHLTAHAIEHVRIV
jgi:hypothetical protein